MRRRILIGAAVGLIVGIAVFLRPAAGTRTAVGSTAALPVRTPPPTSAPTPAAVTPPPPGGGSASGLDPLQPDALVASASAEYRRRARYPRSSHPLDDGPDPLERDREVSRVTQRGQSGEDPALTVYPSATGFEDPEPAMLHAYLTNGGRRIRARTIRATITTEDLQPIGAVEYRDDGTGGDAAANDRIYTAMFLPAGEAVLSRSYLVQVAATTRAGDERLAATSFLYSRPHAHLTGNYRDAVVNGNLEVGVEVDVATAGRFHVEATLYGGDGTQKVAWAQAARVLEPGRHWIPLQYYGLILRERDLVGPYVVRWVALSTTTEMPNAKNRLFEANHRTATYDPTLFTDRAFDDPDMVDAADRAAR